MDNMDNKDKNDLENKDKNDKNEKNVNTQLQEYDKGDKAIQEYKEDPYRNYKQPKSNMLNRQLIIIALCVVVIGGLAGAYFGIVAPMLEEAMKPAEKEEIPLLEGEELGTTDRIMITPKVDRKETKNVYVNNKVDEFRVIHHLGNDSYI